ncbi:hypothetical protein E2562_019407 [Oryza meyeriana var. granulata]|uniref:Uncharacterized protein n=1 Tax=Oryza meyeriana var. granulata TaxID=110450 RepID=A0A6G1DK22_9ORYZ|nr:hypothetical protein E2562_019407 [Oryza meyeriana var. granulata]
METTGELDGGPAVVVAELLLADLGPDSAPAPLRLPDFPASSVDLQGGEIRRHLAEELVAVPGRSPVKRRTSRAASTHPALRAAVVDWTGKR